MSMTDLKVPSEDAKVKNEGSFSLSKNFANKSFLNSSKLNQSKILNPTQSKYQQFLERKKSQNQSKLIPSSPEKVRDDKYDKLK